MQSFFWSLCIGALAMAGFANWADRRRSKRRNLDAVGLMPWPLILILAILVAAASAALALRAG